MAVSEVLFLNYPGGNGKSTKSRSQNAMHSCYIKPYNDRSRKNVFGDYVHSMEYTFTLLFIVSFK
jgi:hypothetical protein